jgi:hypothetical protein
MLDPEAILAALWAAAGEVQALMNHLGLAARSAPATKLAFEGDLQASLRKSLQFGRTELVSIESNLGPTGMLATPTDVVVAAKSKVPQLAIELEWHPKGEDHGGFANQAMSDLVKMVMARTRGAVEQATVLIGAPSRFWRWLPGYAEERTGYELLDPEPDTPVSVNSEFLAGTAWDFAFDEGLDPELPERLWSSLLGRADVLSPWADVELRLLEVKGLGALQNVRPGERPSA